MVLGVLPFRETGDAEVVLRACTVRARYPDLQHGQSPPLVISATSDDPPDLPSRSHRRSRHRSGTWCLLRCRAWRSSFLLHPSNFRSVHPPPHPNPFRKMNRALQRWKRATQRWMDYRRCRARGRSGRSAGQVFSAVEWRRVVATGGVFEERQGSSRSASGASNWAEDEDCWWPCARLLQQLDWRS